MKHISIIMPTTQAYKLTAKPLTIAETYRVRLFNETGGVCVRKSDVKRYKELLPQAKIRLSTCPCNGNSIIFYK